MESYKMTVAVVCYNNESTIAKAIKSVEEQSMNGIEILVIDDCSTDGSCDVIQELLSEGSEFSFFSTEKNSGSASASRNIAIDKAQGQYLTFLDGDDVLAENACFNLYSNAKKYSVDIVTAQMVRRQVVSGKSTPWHGWLFKESRTLSHANEEPDLVYDSTSTNKTYSIDFLRDNGLRFTEGVYFEDNEFSQKAFALANGIRVIPDVVYFWEVYPAEERLTITADWQNVRSYSDRIRAFAIGYNSYGDAGMNEIQDKLLNKTAKHDIWLFIDAAFKNKDFPTLMNLWKEAKPVIDLLKPEDLDEIPLKQRAKIAALISGDLDAFSEAFQISSNPRQLKGYFADGMWLPSTWEKDMPQVSEVREYLKVRNDQIGSFSDEQLQWRHRAFKVVGREGKVFIEGGTEDRFGYFDHSAPLEVFGRLMMNGGDIVQTVKGDFDSWAGSVAKWTLCIQDVLEDTLLRNQQWRLELSLVQGEKYAQAEIQSPPKYKPIPFSPRTVSLKGLTLDRLGLFAWKGRALYVRRWSREMPYGVGARALSTYARYRDAGVKKITAGTSKDRILQSIGIVARKLPLDRDLVIFESHMGKQYSDSPRAIYEELLKRNPDLTIYWSTADTSKAGVCPSNLVRRHSETYARLLARAAVVVDNQGFPSYYKARSDQMYLQTWHGVPLKQMGKNSHSKSSQELAEIKKSVDNWSLTFSPTPYYQRELNEAMFYDGATIVAGLPRNDCLVGYDDETKSKIKKELGLENDKRFILWAPTFREEGKYGIPKIDSLLNLEEFVDELPKEVVLLVRAHYLNQLSVPKNLAGRVINVSNIDEISKLYIASDLLITDYSSVMFDFSITGKPIIIFAPDFDDYKDSQRGIIFDISTESPGPFVTTQSELSKEIFNLISEPVNDTKYSEFVEKYVGKNDGSASKVAVDRILKWMGK